ncbi:MAG: DUF1735 domain-containing protein [Bacteroidaceae bacterium]|nr:DUF1735 domain-containing protein [Bacteroidaceae bacterium]
MKKIYSIALMAFAVVGLSSCLKDEYLYDYDNQTPVIEFMVSDGNTKGVTVTEKAPNPTLEFFVNYSISEWQNIKQDITVTVSIDNTLTQNPLLPAEAYTIDTESYAKTASNMTFPIEMVIPAAEKQDTSVRTWWNNHRNTRGVLNITNPDVLEKGVTYALPMKITGVNPQVTIISGNFGHQIITVTKNY